METVFSKHRVGMDNIHYTPDGAVYFTQVSCTTAAL